MKNLHRSLLIASAVVGTALNAQTPLPDARAVLTRYAEATNAAKIPSIAGRHVTGTVEMAAQGLKGSVESYADATGRTTQMMSLGPISFRTGMEATFAWSIDPMQGPKIIEGRQFIEQREDLDPRAMRRDPALVVSAQTVERATMNEQPCVKLKLTWKSGKETLECYSETTGLLVSKEATETSDMGSIQSTTLYNEYKVFDGITMPTRTNQRVAGTELVFRVVDVKFGAVDPAKLELPAEIKALRK